MLYSHCLLQGGEYDSNEHQYVCESEGGLQFDCVSECHFNSLVVHVHDGQHREGENEGAETDRAGYPFPNKKTHI